MKSILLFMVYYGNLPNYFNIWLNTAKNNSTIEFCIITDCIKDPSTLPKNIKLLYLSFEEFKEQIQNKFYFPVSIKNYGRISQFRPALAYIFPDIVKKYDYWGFIECDLIMGDIRAFITDDILENYDKLFKLGHFQIFKNNQKMNTLFMQKARSALNYKFAFRQNVLFFEEVIGMHNLANAFKCKTYYKNVFADIKCYEYMFCRSPYGYSNKHVEKQCLLTYENGKLFCYSIESGKLQKEEILYAHFQKRTMEVMTRDINKFLIIPNKFINYQNVTLELFESIKNCMASKEFQYRELMKEKLILAQRQRYKELCWWKLKLIRRKIKKHGGIDLDGR